MFLAIASILFSIIAVFSGKIIIPIIGFGLGVSCLIRENRKENKKRSIYRVTAIGILLNFALISGMLIAEHFLLLY